ncbi:MAG: cytochrome c family protein, partial [Gemmatimonadota bacterium]|nr:cytochrome c family protein [Gemmatimonadota bacterium]
MRLLVRPAAAVLMVAGMGGLLWGQEPPSFEDSPFLRIDPEKIVMSSRDARVPCGECHVDEFAVWEQTPHATGFNTLHRSDGAADILERMDLQVAKRQESLCLRCHYTVDTSLRAIAGVSCESCHGAARDWIDVHNDLGTGVERPEDESPEHRAQRVEASVAGGMLRPSGDLYSVAANCFECHTVPIEDLVNRGRHSTGSARFELVEWADRIRHNYVEAQWTPGSENREPTTERKRVAYAVGKLLDYEFSIRGMAAATEDGRYAKGMERRVSDAYRQLEAIASAQPVPQVVEVLRIGKTLPIQPGNQTPLLAAADRMRTLGQAFAADNDGSGLAALDALVEGGGATVATAPEASPASDEGSEDPQAPPADPVTETAAPEAATPAAAEPAPAAPPRVSVGEIRARPAWFPPEGAFEVIDPGCSCHGDAEDWWFEDSHESAHFRLLNQEPRAVQIATLYG